MVLRFASLHRRPSTVRPVEPFSFPNSVSVSFSSAFPIEIYAFAPVLPVTTFPTMLYRLLK